MERNQFYDKKEWKMADVVRHYRDFLTDLYKIHVKDLNEKYSFYGTQTGYDLILVYAGEQKYYFADDQEVKFVPTPHFAHWVPLASPESLIIVRPGQKPLLLIYAPQDYWHEDPSHPLSRESYRFKGLFGDQEDLTAESFQVRIFDNLGDLKKNAVREAGQKKCAWIGPEVAAYSELNWDREPSALISRLNWNRAIKSDYEVLAMWIAQVSGARGHKALYQTFLAGDVHELDLHLAFLNGAEISEDKAPYGSIIALNERARVLHYRPKRTLKEPLLNVLIDAGSQFRGYPSDISRTIPGPKASKVYKDLVATLDRVQKVMVDLLVPAKGLTFVTMHEKAHEEIAKILIDAQILRGVSVEAAKTQGLTRAFFPHGLGHHLGLQVHDVGGKQNTPEGPEFSAPESVPGGRYLRNIRTLEVGHVVTVEPGIYFIPMLLNEILSGPLEKHLNQSLITELMPHGGIRIEDDIYLSSEGPVNLTRRAFGFIDLNL